MNPRSAGIGIFFNPATDQAINVWRQRYDPHINDLSPHITVVYPPFIGIDIWRLKRDLLVKSLEQFQRFKIIFKELGVFDQKEFVLWLKPEDNGRLWALRQHLAEILPEYIDPPTIFKPHVSLGFFENQKELDQARFMVEQEFRPLSTIVDKVSYIVLGQDGRWQSKDEIKLGR